MDDEAASFFSLREFMDLRFLPLERAIANLQSAIERIAFEMVTHQQFERVLTEVDALRDKIDELEKRVARHDADMRIVKWVGGVVASVTMYLVVAYLRSLLGV